MTLKIQSHVVNSEKSVGKCAPFDGIGRAWFVENSGTFVIGVSRAPPCTKITIWASLRLAPFWGK